MHILIETVRASNDKNVKDHRKDASEKVSCKKDWHLVFPLHIFDVFSVFSFLNAVKYSGAVQHSCHSLRFHAIFSLHNVKNNIRNKPHGKKGFCIVEK